MSGFLGGLLRGGMIAKQGWNKGEQVHQDRQQEVDEQAAKLRREALRDALLDQAEKRRQADSDRNFGETVRYHDGVLKKPLPPHNIDPRSKEGIDADARKAEIRARINAKYRAPRTGGSGGNRSPITGLTHAATAVKNQLSDVSKEITAAQKVEPLDRHSTPQDSAIYNAATANLPKLLHKKDSLQSVYGNIAAKVQSDAGVPVPQEDPAKVAARAQALYNSVKQRHPQMDDNVIRGAVRKQLQAEGHNVQ